MNSQAFCEGALTETSFERQTALSGLRPVPIHPSMYALAEEINQEHSKNLRQGIAYSGQAGAVILQPELFKTRTAGHAARIANQPPEGDVSGGIDSADENQSRETAGAIFRPRSGTSRPITKG